jgi:hypothetical protein
VAAGNCTQFSKGLGMDATGNPFKVYVLFQMGSQDWYLSDTFHLQLHIYDLSIHYFVLFIIHSNFSKYFFPWKVSHLNTYSFYESLCVPDVKYVCQLYLASSNP